MKQGGNKKTTAPVWSMFKKNLVEGGNETMKILKKINCVFDALLVNRVSHPLNADVLGRFSVSTFQGAMLVSL